MTRVRWVVAAAIITTSTIASAQGGPPGSTSPVAPAAPAVPIAAPAPPGLAPPAREDWIGLGPGVTGILGSPHIGDQAFGGVTLEARQVRRAGPDDLLRETVVTLLFHDFETIGNGYGWFFEDGHQKKRLGTGWPALLFVPLAGANAYLAQGWVTDPGPGGFWGGAGIQLQMFLRPSLDCFEFDLGFGPYLVLGHKLGDRTSLDLRALYANPIYHSLDDKATIHGVTTTLVLSIRSKQKKRKTVR